MNNNFSFHFPLIRKKKTTLQKGNRYLLFISIIAAISLCFVKIDSNVYYILLGTFLGCLFIWLILDVFIKGFKIIGKINLMYDRIVVEDGEGQKEFPIKNICNLKVRYGGYDGQNYESVFYDVGFLRSKDGSENYIEFDCNDVNSKFMFYIEFNNKPLHKIVSSWREDNVNVEFIDENAKDIQIQ